MNMVESDLIQAVLADPEDDGPRLAYAGWLEANNHVDRAEWIRASVAFAGVSSAEPGWQALFKRVYDSWFALQTFFLGVPFKRQSKE